MPDFKTSILYILNRTSHRTYCHHKNQQKLIFHQNEYNHFFQIFQNSFIYVIFFLKRCKINKMKIKILPFDVLLILAILLISFFLIKNSGNKNNGRVFVQADGKKFEYSLQNNGVFTVQGEIGITSFEISDNKVRIIDSPCPNKTCIACGWSNSVVCLPNKVFVQIENSAKHNDKVQFDAVSD